MNRPNVLRGTPFRDFWRLAKPFWTESEGRWLSWGMFVTCIACTIGVVYTSVIFNDWNRAFYDTLQHKDLAAFPKLLIKFALIIVVILTLAIFKFYLAQLLQIRWRTWMNENYIRRWLAKRSYYLLPLLDGKQDNPDQRIAEDLSYLASESLDLVMQILRDTLTLISFGVILWKLSTHIAPTFQGHSMWVPGYLFWIALVYATVGTGIIHLIGRKLVPYDVQQQKYEADYRVSLVRIRENAESIALSHGENVENSSLLRKYQYIYDNFRSILGKRKLLVGYDAFHSSLVQIVVIFVAAPSYFSSSIELGDFMQIFGAFGKVQDAMAFFIGSYSIIAHWRSVVIRLRDFVHSLDRLERGEVTANIEPSESPAGNLECVDLTLLLPDGKPIVKSLSFRAEPGDRVIVTGRSGTGKSTLLRTIAGIWPFLGGKVLRPRNDSAMFLPQRPYVPEDTLKAAIAYPMPTAQYSEPEYREVMKLADLEKFEPQLDHTANWMQVLSPGEQQRVAIARAMLHKPAWLFLDETTSALDEATQELVISRLVKMLPTTTFITVAHRESLKKFHTRELDLDKYSQSAG